MSADRKWGLRHLLAGWGTYWGVLAVTTLATPLRILLQVTNQADDTGTASVSFANDVLNASISSYGKTVWTGSTPLLTMMFWIAAPPLLMWFVWLVTRSRASVDPAPSAMSAGIGAAQLSAPPPTFAHGDHLREKSNVTPSRTEYRQP